MKRELGTLVLAAALMTVGLAPAAAADARPSKEWTVLVYLAADNDLAEFGLIDINEMEVVGSTDDVNVVVQFDGSKKHSPGHEGSCRYYIEKDADFETITSPVVQDMGEVDMGSQKTLVDFLSWGIETYPAKKYFLVVWNHGSGWYQDLDTSPLDFTAPKDVQDVIAAVEEIQGGGKPELDKIIVARRIRDLMRPETAVRPFGNAVSSPLARNGLSRSIAVDEGGSTATALSTTDIREALAAVSGKLLAGERIEMIGFDACLMGMVEVMHEIRDGARWAIGSQKTEPGDGWAYDVWLKALADEPSMDGKALGKAVIDSYTDHYAQTNTQVTNPFHKVNGTLALVDLDEMAPLTAAVEKLGTALAARPENRELAWKAVIETQHCGEIGRTSPTLLLMMTGHRDVVDFARNIKAVAPKAEGKMAESMLGALADNVIAAHDKAVVTFRRLEGTPLLSVKNTHGLAVFIPFLKLDATYSQLQMGKGPWAKTFINWFKATPAEAQQLIAIMTDEGQQAAEGEQATRQKRFGRLYKGE